jgi:hypothetical protein
VENVTTLGRFFKKEMTGNFVFHQSAPRPCSVKARGFSLARHSLKCGKPDDDLDPDKAERNRKVTTLNKLEHSLVSGFISEMDWIHLAQDKGSYEHGSETLSSIKGAEFLDSLSDY